MGAVVVVFEDVNRAPGHVLVVLESRITVFARLDSVQNNLLFIQLSSLGHGGQGGREHIDSEFINELARGH